MIAVIFIACLLLLFLAYQTYGRYIERALGVNRDRPTPAVELRDGVDFVAASPPVLFGHHFSSIAGAGPIVGPIIAGLAYGWLPALLWIVLGAIFVGGVHDFTALVASIRHRGHTLGQVCRGYLSPLTYHILLIFIWFALIYVIVVFLDLTAITYAPTATAAMSATERATAIAQGGTVATASLLYIAIAILFGLAVYKFKVPFRAATAFCVPLIFIGLWVGYRYPIGDQMVPALLGSTKNTWSAMLLAYCFVASVTPVWILLQPRDYLSSFLLLACVLGGSLGLLLGGGSGAIAIQYPAYRGFVNTDFQLGPLFPALFITIACGAVSGFHSIVASGTTSKQLDNEGSARPIAYGAMLVEALLAIIALSAVMMLPAHQGGTPIAVFAAGIGRCFAMFHFPEAAATTFGLLAVSTFLLTTLDTCTRLARFILQELFRIEGPAARIGATAASLALPTLMAFTEISGPGGVPMPAWKAIWPVFGTSNQLLAALALMVVYAWLRHEGRKTLYVLIPMLFMGVTTLTSLARLAGANLTAEGSMLIGITSAALGLMAMVVTTDTAIHLSRGRPGRGIRVATHA